MGHKVDTYRKGHAHKSHEKCGLIFLHTRDPHVMPIFQNPTHPLENGGSPQHCKEVDAGEGHTCHIAGHQLLYVGVHDNAERAR